ncbi:hypothetical protein [Dactylosporangium sp. CA-233914]|uniref:hypothetical protein n=1 Tax=Dactylosporangium sp. CA-233914 TaxID=3239934 RepID=UPI003D8FDD1A
MAVGPVIWAVPPGRPAFTVTFFRRIVPQRTPVRQTAAPMLAYCDPRTKARLSTAARRRKF